MNRARILGKQQGRGDDHDDDQSDDGPFASAESIAKPRHVVPRGRPA